MNLHNQDFYRTTYEYESNQLNKKYNPYEETKNILFGTSPERFSNSPIILCETGSRNNKYHRHRYLFYPSASRLSPYGNNYNSDINNIKYSFRDKNNFELENKNNLINKNETDLKENENEKSPEKYQAMYNKSFELVKRISELVPEENIKIKGNSDYYLNQDKDYINIIDNEINTLTNHFKNSNFNLGYKTDGNLYNNSNYIPKNDNDKNDTYDEYKNNLLQRIKDSNINNKIEPKEELPYNDKNELYNSNRNYINDYINNMNKNNIQINEPEIQVEENLKNNIKNKNEINNNENNINNDKQKYENKNFEKEEDNNIEKEQLIDNNNNLENNIKNDFINEEELNNDNNMNLKNTKPSTKYNTLGMIQNDNINQNQFQYHPYDNNYVDKNINQINENNKKNEQKNKNNEQEISPYQLIDGNNKQILSSDKKPFVGELIDYQYQKGNQIFINSKSGTDIKLDILRGKEGEPLCYKGYPLMGKDNKFFYDKNGNIVLYPDNEFIKGDKTIQVRIIDNKGKNGFIEFNTNKNKIENNDYDMGKEYGSNGSGGFQKNKMKYKWYMFPKGNGGAKAPIIKTKNKRKNKKFS